MKKKILFLVVTLFLIGVIWLLSKNNQATVGVGGLTLRVEVAKTVTQREKGLSGHAPLATDAGMLFVFEQSDIYSFWMKDMLFPIDIIWLAPSDVEGISKVVYIKKDAKPESYPESFIPDQKAIYVLEVNSGFSHENNLKVGDEVKIGL